jgi:hypothetical protein
MVLLAWIRRRRVKTRPEPLDGEILWAIYREGDSGEFEDDERGEARW